VKKGIKVEESKEKPEIDDTAGIDQMETYLVAPTYKPLAIYDKKRNRRLAKIKNHIEDNELTRSVTEKNYNKCIICSSYEVI
tara:strand:- start:100 stop:345 length:246 start_codon:yes stop_codon:yes gene_type:complete